MYNKLCKRYNIELIYAPATNHRPIGLVELLMQTVKRRLGCIKLDPNQNPFNIKNALQNTSFELHTCRKKILISPLSKPPMEEKRTAHRQT